jgi:hypothetical protein
MQTVLAYSIATGGATTDADETAVADQVFAIKNNHFVFTNPYNLRAAMAIGATITRQNFQPPSWEAISRLNIWPISVAAGIPSNPQMMWLDGAMPQLPQYEEFLVKSTGTTSETDYTLLWLQTPGHNSNIPPGDLPMPIRATVTLTLSAGAWVQSGALTFEKSLRGGNYSVIGFQAQCTNGLAVRLISPRMRLYAGQPLRPGFLCQNAIADVPEAKVHLNPWFWGEVFRFHSYEPPTIEVLGNTSGSQTLELRFFLRWLGGSEMDLAAWASQAWA